MAFANFFREACGVLFQHPVWLRVALHSWAFGMCVAGSLGLALTTAKYFSRIASTANHMCRLCNSQSRTWISQLSKCTASAQLPLLLANLPRGTSWHFKPPCSTHSRCCAEGLCALGAPWSRVMAGLSGLSKVRGTAQNCFSEVISAALSLSGSFSPDPVANFLSWPRAHAVCSVQPCCCAIHPAHFLPLPPQQDGPQCWRFPMLLAQPYCSLFAKV